MIIVLLAESILLEGLMLMAVFILPVITINVIGDGPSVPLGDVLIMSGMLSLQWLH